MSAQLMMGLMSLMPSAALWLSGPKRAWVGWACAGSTALVWLVGLVAVGPETRAVWAAAGATSLGACLWAGFVVQRNAGDSDKLGETLLRRRATAAELTKGLASAKARSKDVETEQREVHALYGMVKGMAEVMTWDGVRPKLEAAVEQYLRVEEFAVYVAEQKAGDSMRLLARRRLSGSPGATWDTLSRWMQENAVAMTVARVVDKPERAVAVPIFESEKLMGYFYARIPRDADAEAMLMRAQTFVEEIAFAFRRIRLFQEMEKFSLVDGLTGAYRRRVLDERLAEEVVRGQTFKTSFCLMLLDIDKFKNLNDSYGHQFGDEVLRRVGEILRGSVYETDFVARYGGEEFAILLPRAEPAGVLRKAEALRKAIETASFELAMQRVSITISLGIAHYPRDGAASDAIVRQADRALYHAKDTGRNRVVDVAEIPRKA